MNSQVQRKQIITLALSILLAIGSYWIPLPESTPTQKTVSSSQPVVGERLGERVQESMTYMLSKTMRVEN
jgi:hypothetical protein